MSYDHPLNQMPNQPSAPASPAPVGPAPVGGAGPAPAAHAAAAPPAGSPQYYAPPTHGQGFDYQSLESFDEDQGNYWLGFAAGFVFALLGLIIVYITAKEDTKNGAVVGFFVRLGLTVFFLLIINMS